MNICITFRDNPSDSCWDISVWNKVVDWFDYPQSCVASMAKNQNRTGFVFKLLQAKHEITQVMSLSNFFRLDESHPRHYTAVYYSSTPYDKYCKLTLNVKVSFKYHKLLNKCKISSNCLPHNPGQDRLTIKTNKYYSTLSFKVNSHPTT